MPWCLPVIVPTLAYVSVESVYSQCLNYTPVHAPVCVSDVCVCVWWSPGAMVSTQCMSVYSVSVA